ncbi:MAG: glycosyl transferase [Candidatus Dojkabacteria bacterium]|nr:MAG: glycosyl transferase [Candidatus Dojkabacteria bacterium]
MSKIKVSVVIPCYNYGHLIDETIASVEKQSYKNIEIVIVNDASTDVYTNEHLSKLSKKYKVVTHKKNKGLPEARNTGVKNSEGDLILTLDSDDKISKYFIEKIVNKMISTPNAGIGYGKTVYFGDLEGERMLPPFSIGEMLIRNLIPSCAMFYKSDWEKVGGFKRSMKFGYEDYDFWLSIIEMNKKVVFEPEVIFYYRKHKQAITQHSISQMQNEKVDYSLKTIIKNHQALYIDNMFEFLKAAHNLAIQNENLQRIVKEREEHIKYFKKYVREKDEQVKIYKGVVEAYERKRKNFLKLILKKLKRLVSKFN